MKLRDKIIFWVVFALLFIACIQSLFGAVVFVGLVLIFNKGIRRFYRGDWFWIR